MGRIPAFPTILGALLAATPAVTVSCGGAEPTASAPTSSPVPPASPTATTSAPDPRAELATPEGALSRFSGIGDRLGFRLPEDLSVNLPGGVDLIGVCNAGNRL